MQACCGDAEHKHEQALLKKIAFNAVYEHYRGKRYRVLAVARDSEDKKLRVIYQALYDCPSFGSQPIWDRPLEMFLENVVVNGQHMPRFRQI